jgi:predicted transcriptional regulator
VPLGVVNSADWDKELDSLEIRDQKIGRGSTRQVPTSLRKVISDTAIKEGNTEAKALAKSFGLSDSSVSAYKHGATSTATYNEPDRELEEHVIATKNKVAKSAYTVLRSALNHITEDKLVDAKPSALSVIAVNMASVQFVFYAPPQRTESDFEVIDVVE